MIRWENTSARAVIYVDTRVPCPFCNGGEYWECGPCLGSGFSRVAFPGSPSSSDEQEGDVDVPR